VNIDLSADHRLLAILADNDGAMLYWQVPPELVRVAELACAGHSPVGIRFDADLLVHPDAQCIAPGIAYCMPRESA